MIFYLFSIEFNKQQLFRDKIISKSLHQATMKDLIIHFNRKKQDFNNFFLSITKIIEQVSHNTQLQIDKEYDAIMSQFSNAPKESILSACQQMEKNRQKIFRNIIDALYEQLQAYICSINKQNNKKNQIQQKINHESNNFKQVKPGVNNISSVNKNSINNQINMNANTNFNNNNNHIKNSSANIRNGNIEDRLSKKEILVPQRISNSPPKIVFKSNPTNSYQFNYNNNNQSIFQSNVQQYKQIPFVQQKNTTSFNYQNQKQIQKNPTTYYSGKANNLQKISQFNTVNNWIVKDQRDQKQKFKRRISVTKNQQICENLDKIILSEANQLLQKSQSRKKFSSLKRSNASYKRSPQRQGKYINLVNGTVNVDKILQTRIGEHQLSASKKIVLGSQDYTSPIKKYNI